MPLVATLVALTLLGSCATREELIAKSAIVPMGIDLSGQWQLQPASHDTMGRISEAEIEAAGGKERLIKKPERDRQAPRRRQTDGTLVHVFLETGRSLKVTQTEHGLFISFDRSVVEEYRFGEQREISVGPVVADRVSGWKGDTYIIETLDKDGAKLIETYRLRDNGRSLIRTISIMDNGLKQLELEQAFDQI